MLRTSMAFKPDSLPSLGEDMFVVDCAELRDVRSSEEMDGDSVSEVYRRGA